MPDSGSRWSSSRERDELQKQRALERERIKQERIAREAGEELPSDAGKRRLSDDQRDAIRQPRFSTTPPTNTPVEGSTPADSSSSNPPDDEVVAPSTVGTRWRDSVSPPPPTSGMPNLPGDDDKGKRRGPGSSRLIIFGLCLFAIMGALAFTPLGPFGGDDDPPQPTPRSTLPSILGTLPALDGVNENTQIEEPQAASGQAVVCIDPGHGGWDTGWNRTEIGDNPYGPPITTEAQLNLGMAYMLKEELVAKGYFVVLTREGGAAVNMFDEDANDDGETRADSEQAGDRDELQARINVCNDADANVLISVHVDGFDDRSATGFHVFYTAEREFGEQNELLANLVYREMDAAMRDTEMANLGMGARPDTEIDSTQYEYGTADHFIMTGPAVEIASIEPSMMPGIIVEAGFLSNDRDAIFLVQPANQRLLVRAYADGIEEYFAQYPPAG